MRTLNFVFRVDSGLNIGIGHLVRCISLAKLLVKNDLHNCIFVCRPHLGNVSAMILENKFTLLMLPTPSNTVTQTDCKSWLGTSQSDDAAQTNSLLAHYKIKNIDLLIIDHYAIDYEWQSSFSGQTSKVLVIDDLADRYHECDFLLDQNLASNYKIRYKNLVPERCEEFLGVSYCILKEDFFEVRKTIKPRYLIDNLLIFFGGVDKDNCTTKVLWSLKDQIKNFSRVDVVVGAANPNKHEVEQICLKYDNCVFHEQISNMAELIAHADFSIGACGATMGERIFLGLPSIIFSVADNQVEVSHYLHEAKYVYYLGDHSLISGKSINNAIKSYLGTARERKIISAKLLEISSSNIDDFIARLSLSEGK